MQAVLDRAGALENEIATGANGELTKKAVASFNQRPTILLTRKSIAAIRLV